MVYQLSTSLQYVVAKDAASNPNATSNQALPSHTASIHKPSNGVFSSPFRPESESNSNLKINGKIVITFSLSFICIKSIVYSNSFIIQWI